jgi:hypothetical protein
MYYLISGIARVKQEPDEQIKITVHGPGPNDYQTFTYPSTRPLNKNKIEKFIAQQLGVSQDLIKWEDYIKIPEY